jgi:chitosanase
MRSDQLRVRAITAGVVVPVLVGGVLFVNHSAGGDSASGTSAAAGTAPGTAPGAASGTSAGTDPGTSPATPPAGASTAFPTSSPGASGGPSSATPTPKPSQHATTPTHPAATTKPRTGSPTGGTGLDDPAKKEIAMELVSSAENSSLNWRAQYSYIEDIGDGRGYTAGIIGFCSGTGDMLEVVQHFAQLEPNNVLAKYLPALQKDNGSSSHSGLDPNFTKDWKTAASDPLFQQSQDWERDGEYFDPAVSQAKADGLGTLGQFVYYDAMVMHGQGSDPLSFGGLRSAAMKKAKTPTQGGDETAYLNAFLDVRRAVMKSQPAWSDTSRIDTEQRVFLQAGNLNLNTPLHWSTYGDPYTIG